MRCKALQPAKMRRFRPCRPSSLPVEVIARERDGLKNDLNLINVKNQLEEKAIKEKYEVQIKERDGAITRLWDMKARLSTKMVGET